MEHRHVLVEGDLKPRGRGGLQQRRQLGGIKVIRGGDAFEPVMLNEPLGGEAIGDVE